MTQKKDKLINELWATIDELMGKENIRDKFALAALPWCLDQYGIIAENGKKGGLIMLDDMTLQGATARAYRIAEAMLDARKK